MTNRKINQRKNKNEAQLDSDEIKPMLKQRNKFDFLMFMQVEVSWVRNS